MPASAGGAEESLTKPVELFTPGFSLSRARFEAYGTEGDLYALATTMAYFIFPIAAMSFLREDILDTYRVFIDGLGWPERIHRLLTDLAAARIGLTDVLRELEHEAELLDQVGTAPRRPVAEEEFGLGEAEAGVAAFVAAVADGERDSLFPVDPFAHVTNPLSLGFGASGVLWALNSSGIVIRPEWRDWLGGRLESLDADRYPDGLMSGLAGIAWAADSLGLSTRARELLDRANDRAFDSGDYSFYYGLAGVGMTNLRFFLRGHDPRDLAAALECAQALCDTVQRDGARAYWLNEFATDGPLTGLGFGQAGCRDVPAADAPDHRRGTVSAARTGRALLGDGTRPAHRGRRPDHVRARRDHGAVRRGGFRRSGPSAAPIRGLGQRAYRPAGSGRSALGAAGVRLRHERGG